MLKRWRERAKSDKDRKKKTGYDFAESFKRIEFRRPQAAAAQAESQAAAPAAAASG
jgi:hypothetical protein